MYLSPHESFDYGRDHPSALVWEEEGLTYDWAEGNNDRRISLNVSREAVLAGATAGRNNVSSSVRGLWMGGVVDVDLFGVYRTHIA